MLELAAKQVSDSRESDVRMRAHVDALTGDELGWTRLIEEYEWADHLPFGRGKRAPHLEIADVAGSGHDQRFDRIDAHSIGATGLERGVPTHRGLLSGDA